MLRPGDTFDRYVVDAVLGQGGMGQVVRARDTRLARSVALKVVLPSASPSGTSGEATARLLREARAAAALEHPNAVHVYDCGEHDGRAFIAMELVDGETLRRRTGGAPLATRLGWLVDVARALDAAHRIGIVHRDVAYQVVVDR